MPRWTSLAQFSFALALLTFGGGAVDLRAQMFVSTGRDTLRALPGVEVVVDEMPEALTAAGITAGRVRRDVIDRLRAAEVPVFASSDQNSSPAQPYLYVLVNVLELPRDGGHVASLQVQLRQTLRSPVTGSSIVDAMTWDAHNVVVAPPGALGELRDEIGSYVDLFIRDWHAVQ